MRHRLILFLLVPGLVAVMVGVGLAALRPGQSAPAAGPDADGSEPAASETAAGWTPPAVAPTLVPTELPTPTASPSEEPSERAPSYDVAAVQQRLTELRYYLGPVDGREGPSTRSAVMAFQKVNGLSVDGVVGPQTLAALASPVTPTLQGGSPTRIEVDLTRQVLYYVEGGEIQRVMPVSSGSGRTYRTSSGGTARSLTPVGTYHIQRRIRGLREADLGSLYDPMYFYRGWAIHGSNSVPAYPASHGCIRLPRADALWLFERAPVGMQVVIYGGSHTFRAGSSAPGTDTPAGDTPTDTAPSEQPSPAPTQQTTPTPSEQPSPPPTAHPSPTEEPSPTPSPSASASPSEGGAGDPNPPPLPGT